MPLQPEEIVELLKPALACTARSRARGRAVKAASDQAGVTPRAIREWLGKIERTRSASVFVKKERSDKGKPRVCVSKVYDQALLPRVGRDGLMAIERDLVRQIRRVLRTGLTSAKEIRIVHVNTWLKAYTKDLGTGLSDRELDLCCKVPWSKIRPHRHVRVGHIKETDSRKFHDDYLVRARRTREGLWFNAIVCIDCTAVDVLCRDEDGREYTARAIVMQDLATNTLMMHVLFPKPGKGINYRHVGEALLRWCEQYGPFGQLLTDHGSEFRKLGVLDDLFRLSARVGVEQLSILNPDLEPKLLEIIRGGMLDVRSTIRRAAKFNAPAKPVEGQNAMIMRFMLAATQGFIGNDRTRQPTKQQGRPAEFWRGSKAGLIEEMNLGMATFDALPQSGNLKGKSPREARQQLIDAGYCCVGVNIKDLRNFLSDRVECRIRKGVLTIKGAGVYESPKVSAKLKGTRFTALVPWTGDLSQIALLDEDDKFVDYVTPVRDNHHLALEGAKNQRARAAAQMAQIDAIDAEIEPYDPNEGRRRFVAQLPNDRQHPTAGLVQIGKEIQQIPPPPRALPAPAKEPEPSGADLWARLYDQTEAKAPVTLKRGSK